MSAISKFSFLDTNENENVVFTGYQMKVYIPADTSALDKNFEEIGQFVRILGLFNFRVFSSEKDTSGRLFGFTLPSSFISAPSNIDFATLALFPEDEPERYLVLTYDKGDMFMHSLGVEQSAKDAYTLVSMVHAGKVPSSVSYDKIVEVYQSIFNIHKVSSGVDKAIEELIIAAIARDANDYSRPYRMIYGKTGTESAPYKPFNLKNLPMISSTFAALSFERIHDSINASVQKTKTNGKDLLSPIERSIKH